MQKKAATILALFGPCCSGKSSFAEAIRPSGFEPIEVSAVVRLPSGRRVIEASWEELASEIPYTYSTFGRRYFADQLVHYIRSLNSSACLVVCGIRIIEEFHALQTLSDVHLVGLFSSYSTRVARLRAHQPARRDPARYIFKRDLAEAQWGLPALFELVGFDGTIFTDDMDKATFQTIAQSLIPQ